jgi:cytochrome b561
VEVPAVAVRDPDPVSGSDPPAVQEAAQRRVHTPAWNLLLLIPLVGVLIPSIYNKADPTLFDVPFFYWYQMAAIVLSVIVTLAVYQNTRD